MEHFHLMWEELFQPLVLFYIVLYELDGQLTVDFYGSFTFLLSVEPSLCPPYNAVLVWIDTDSTLYVEALNVYIEILERVYYALGCYGVVSSFFFSYSVIVDRNTPCISAR